MSRAKVQVEAKVEARVETKARAGSDKPVGKRASSYRLSPGALEIIAQTAVRLGVPRTAVVELAVRAFSRSEQTS